MATYIFEDEPALETPPRPTMVVFHGGGYSFCSKWEAEPIAKFFFAAGFHCFVLDCFIK